MCSDIAAYKGRIDAPGIHACMHVLLRKTECENMTDEQLVRHMQTSGEPICRYIRSVLKWAAKTYHRYACPSLSMYIEQSKRPWYPYISRNTEYDHKFIGDLSFVDVSKAEPRTADYMVQSAARSSATYTADAWPDLYYWDTTRQCIRRNESSFSEKCDQDRFFDRTYLDVRRSRQPLALKYDKRNSRDVRFVPTWMTVLSHRQRRQRKRAASSYRSLDSHSALDRWHDRTDI